MGELVRRSRVAALEGNTRVRSPSMVSKVLNHKVDTDWARNKRDAHKMIHYPPLKPSQAYKPHSKATTHFSMAGTLYRKGLKARITK